MSLFCTSCGFEFGSSSGAFCGNCGSPVKSNNEGLGSEQAPVAAPGPDIKHDRAAETYALGHLKGWLVGLFVVQALVASWVVSAFLNRMEIAGSLSGSMARRALPLSQMDRLDSDVRDSMQAYLAASFVVLVILVIWTWRVSKNIHSWASPRHPSSWAIGGWFVPLANFVIPYRIIQDGWRLTPTPVFRANRTTFDTVDSPSGDGRLTELPFGWIMWWGGQLLWRFGANAEAGSWQELKNQDLLAAVGFGLSGVGSVLVLIAVRRVSIRQDAYREWLNLPERG